MAWRIERAAFCVALSFACVSVAAAHAGRTPLHAVALASPESTAIVEAERAWMMQNPAMAGVTLEPLLIKRNDEYAYLGARVTGAPAMPYLDAVLELKGGRWESTGYMANTSKPSGSAKEICSYGDGVHREVFRECK